MEARRKEARKKQERRKEGIERYDTVLQTYTLYETTWGILIANIGGSVFHQFLFTVSVP